MRAFIEHLKRLDWIMIGAVTLLLLLGLLTLYATPGDRTNFYKQATFAVASLLVILALSFLDYRVFRDHPFFLISLYVLGLILLGAVFFLGTQIRGVVSWLWLGTLGIQPVELVKIVVLLVLAKYLSRRHIELYRVRHLLVSGFYVFVPAAMVLVQPDLGSALVLVASWVGLIILSGIKARQVAIIVVAGLVATAFLWAAGLKDYQKERVISFLDPSADPLGSSYQTRQSVIALGSGGVFGKGLGEGSQTRLGFLPEFQSDFIFAAIGEEWGFVGAFLVLILWAVIFWRLFVTWRDSTNNFARLFVGGVFVLLFVHFVINIGTNLALLPVTGLPLPFVSYGGSNLLSFSLAIGIVMSIRSHSIISGVSEAKLKEEFDLLAG